MQTVSITLDVNELNTVIGALSELPHKIVADLVPKIRMQAIKQLAPAPVEPAAE